MNIIESTPIMTAIDVVIVVAAAVSIAVVLKLRRRVSARYTSGPLLIASAFGLFGGYFAFDLVTMFVLPGVIGAERAHAVMIDLHLNWTWIVSLVAAVALTAGLLQTSRGVASAASKLEEQEELFESVVEKQNEYIVRWRPDGTRTFVNDAYCRYRRKKREELLGENFFPLIAEVDRDRVHRKMDFLTPEHPTFTDSHRSIAPDGTLRWQEWSDRGIFDSRGRLIEVQSVGRDITDRRRIEEQLENREQQYEAMFNASVNGITVRRLADGRLLTVNPAMAEMFGYGVAEFMELKTEDYVHADSLGLFPQMFETVARGERFPFQARGIHRDGRELELEGHFVPFGFERQRQILGLIQDVTARNRAQAALKASEARLRDLFEAAPDAILVTTLEGSVLDSNPAAARLLGREHQDLIGRHLRDLVDDEGTELAGASYERVPAGDVIQVETVCIPLGGPEVPVSIRANRFNYEGQPAMLHSITDISERRRLEEQLRQSQKMEAVGQLAGGVAHDFNNLLTAILGYAELVETALAADRAAQEDIAEIRRAGERAAGLVGQLLAFSRQQVLRPRVLDLNVVVSEMEKLCRRTIGENVRLSSRLDPAAHRVRADRSQIEQVLLNLAINARDAMPEGGRLTFETGNLSLGSATALHGVEVPAGEYVMLRVTDTGCGMSEEVSRRVFEPFFTTKRPDQGTGLGLSMVYGIVKQSGGFILVDSEEGRGTSFEILLPGVGRAQVGRSVHDDRPVAPIVAAEKTILLVDDNEPVRRIAERALRMQGHRVVATGSAEEALELCRQRDRSFDLLVADFVLPRMDGLELARAIGELWPATRIILMSGYSRGGNVFPEAELEGIRFLSKPFDRRSLLATVAAALRTESEAGSSSGEASEVK